MNRIVIIIVGVLLFLLALYLVWRFVLPRFDNDNDDLTRVVSDEEVTEVFEDPILSPESEALIGQSVLIQNNEVKTVLSQSAFWMGPKGGEGNVIVKKAEHGLAANDEVTVTGTVRNIKDINEDIKPWDITQLMLSQIDLSPYFIEASQITKE